MDKKLQLLMQREDLSPSGLARKLNVNPPVISHILKGRNLPSYDLIRRIIMGFPNVNPYWLLGDSTEMYNNSQSGNIHTSPISVDEKYIQPDSNLFNQSDTTTSMLSDETEQNSNSKIVDNYPQSESDIKYVIVAYNDGTFKSFTPR